MTATLLIIGGGKLLIPGWQVAHHQVVWQSVARPTPLPPWAPLQPWNGPSAWQAPAGKDPFGSNGTLLQLERPYRPCFHMTQQVEAEACRAKVCTAQKIFWQQALFPYRRFVKLLKVYDTFRWSRPTAFPQHELQAKNVARSRNDLREHTRHRVRGTSPRTSLSMQWQHLKPQLAIFVVHAHSKNSNF